MLFLAEQHLVAAKLVRKNGATRTVARQRQSSLGREHASAFERMQRTQPMKLNAVVWISRNLEFPRNGNLPVQRRRAGSIARR
jgi:hypothetical protein